MDVHVIEWPREEARRRALAAAGDLRLLVVAADSAPPLTPDPHEDWVRESVHPEDVMARVRSLEHRFAGSERPAVVDGRLHWGTLRLDLPPKESMLLEALADRFRRVVSRDELLIAGWAGERPPSNALDVQMSRLRARLRPTELQIRTVRGRGYALDERVTSG